MSSPNNDHWQSLKKYIDGCDDINMSFSNVNLQSLEEDPDDFEGIDVCFSEEQWKDLVDGDTNDIIIENNVINDPLIMMADQGPVEMREQDDGRDHTNKTNKTEDKRMSDTNAQASTSKGKSVTTERISEEQAGPSTSSFSAAMPSTSSATEFEKPSGKGKKHACTCNEKDSRGPKVKKTAGKKKDHQ